MGKIVMIIALSAALVRMADNYLYYGKYTDGVLQLANEILHSFGL